LAALAEHRYGGHRATCLATLALGTGVGMGLIVEGRVLNGDHGAAGEVATCPVWSAGRLVELESIVSVAGRLRARGWAHPSRSPERSDDAAAGEDRAMNAITAYCTALAQFIGGLTAIIDPGV